MGGLKLYVLVGILALFCVRISALEIRVPSSQSRLEGTSAGELQVYIELMTGQKVDIVPENQGYGAPVFFIGDTEKARELGLNSSAMPAEHWVVRSVGHDVVLTGGIRRGILYAVYHYLEDVCGVRFWTPDEELVPKRTNLPMDELDLSGTPAFEFRALYSAYVKDNGKFAAKRRFTEPYPKKGVFDPGKGKFYGYESEFGPENFVHTFAFYIPYNEFFATHPEWFCVFNGKRYGAPGAAGNSGQLCLSNPEMRREVLTRLKTNIRHGYAEAAGEGIHPPLLYDVSQNDNSKYCKCSECEQLANKLGNQTDVLLDFVNELAVGIKDEFPEIIINTLAYNYTERIPKTVKPEANVSITLCDTVSNLTTPLTAKDNTYFRNLVEDWSKLTNHLRIWDYCHTYFYPSGLPFPAADTNQADFRLFREHHVKRIFAEMEGVILGANRDFRFWLWCQMAENPDQDYDQLARDFAYGYYGGAGKFFLEYLALLRSSRDQQQAYISPYSVMGMFTYLDLDTVTSMHRMFDAGQEILSGDEVKLRRWRHARMPLDRATLHRKKILMKEYHNRHKKLDGYPFDSGKIAARLDQTVEEQAQSRPSVFQHVIDQEVKKIQQERQDYLREITVKMLEPPRKFKDFPLHSYIDYTADMFTLHGSKVLEVVEDSEAESGITTILKFPSPDPNHTVEKYCRSLPWGVHAQAQKRSLGGGLLTWKQVPKRGFNWYKLGTSTLSDDSYLYFFWSWINQASVGTAYNPLQPDQQYDLWASIKFTGPNFPHGLPDEIDSIRIERVIVIESGKFAALQNEGIPAIPLPEKFQDPLLKGRCFDYTPHDMQFHAERCVITLDKEAECGSAVLLKLKDVPADSAAGRDKPDGGGLWCAVFDPGSGKNLYQTQIAKDPIQNPGYNWYYLGKTKLTANSYFYVDHNKLVKQSLAGAYDPGHPNTFFEIWVKVKFQGKSFHPEQKGSLDSIFIERIILLKDMTLF